ncbi:hypothetical protein [Streptomyces sp. NPDC003395]
MPIREVLVRLGGVGRWRPGDPEILVVLDAGYDGPRIDHLLDVLPVELLAFLTARLRPGENRLPAT